MRANELLQELDAEEKVSFEVLRDSKTSFAIAMYLNGKDVGSFGYTFMGDGARNLAEVSPLHKGKGYGKLLLLKAINTAMDFKIPFYEDSQEVSYEQSYVYDSLFESYYIMQDPEEEDWLITQEGLDYLERHTA